jgi:Protein of unknown function (DUF3891)
MRKDHDLPEAERYAVAMIRRDEDQHHVLIDQYEHSLLSGRLARHIGNEWFSTPAPFESVMKAIAEHDCGWPAHDAKPDLNAHGLPAHALEAESATALPAWTASVDRVTASDAYAGLLVSLHVMALGRYAATKHAAVADEASRVRAFRIQQFLHRQIELQESLRKKLKMRIDLPLHGGLADRDVSPEEDLLRANFFLLEFLDQLSLDLCFDRLIFEKFGPVYPKPGEKAQSMRVERDREGVLRLAPWPFNRKSMSLKVPAKRIAPGPYANAESLAKACMAAKGEQIGVTLQPWQGKWRAAGKSPHSKIIR